MKLIYSGTSPFVRKISVLLLETGQDARVEKRNRGDHSDEPW